MVRLRARDEPIVADRLDAGLGVRPVQRWIVASHPDAGVLVVSARGVSDVVADVQDVVDAGGQRPEEMAAVADSATGPRDAQRAAPGTARRDIRTERHR